MQTSPIVFRGSGVLTAVAAIAFLIIRHFIAVYAGLDGVLDSDEIEYLPAGWLMHRGLRLYRDFAEEHAPLLFVILKWMVLSGVTGWLLLSYLQRNLRDGETVWVRAVRTPTNGVWDLHPEPLRR